MIFSQGLTNFVTVRIPYCTLHGLSQVPQNLNFLTFMACPFLHQIHVFRHNLQRSDRLLADCSEESSRFCMTVSQGIACSARFLITVPLMCEGRMWSDPHTLLWRPSLFSECLVQKMVRT